MRRFSFLSYFHFKKRRAIPSLPFLFGISALIGASSLLTPYPAKLVSEINKLFSSEKKTTEPKKSPVSTLPKKTEIPPLPNITIELPRPTPLVCIPVPPPTPPPPPSPNPGRASDSSIWDVQELSRGLELKTKINFKPGSKASLDRLNKSNYQVELNLNIIKPKIVTSADDLLMLNPFLNKIFPNFEEIIQSAKPSPYYERLYNNKKTRIRSELAQLNRLTTRHNYYDCESILQLETPITKRPVLWIQAEMDVVSDGSDGDRLAEMPDEIVNSTYYQPFTSYFWKKESPTPNPMLAGWENRLKNAQIELKDPKLTASRKRFLKDRSQILKLGIHDLKVKSYLVAEHDPFIVLPLGMIKQSGDKFSPSPGDYCVVIHEDKLYPAIVGDAGPRHKIGEASVRLAQTINAKATSYARPVSDLKVSYIIFPGSADEDKKAPNYEIWHEKCTKLLGEITTISSDFSLHHWEYTFPIPKHLENSATSTEAKAETQKVPNPPKKHSSTK